MAEEDKRSEPELSGEQLKRLLDVGRSLVSELDLETVLRSALDAARDLTGARYAALGILDQEKRALERFVYVGIDQETRNAIGSLPRGRGVLGELIRNPEPLRLHEVGAHPRSFGFPANHPPMKTFLGTPVVIRGEAWGNLYLTEKADGEEFTEADESVVIVLAAWASVAIENARLYEGLDKRRAESERALRGLEVSADISRAGASGMDSDALVGLIAKRGRSLVDARTALVLVAEGDELVVTSAAGERADELVARRVSDARALLGELEISPPSTAGSGVLSVPLPIRGRRPGLLVAVSHGSGAGFDTDDERVFDSYAVNAATTIASVQTAEAEKMRLSMEASERERQRWARELHDETLQELGALRFMLEAATTGTTNQLRAASERAIEHVDRGIGNLQGLITELRPASLDELGVGAALESLVRQTGEVSDARIDATLRLAYAEGRAKTRLSPDLEGAIYRLVQEALNNALKHAAPTRVEIKVIEDDQRVTVIVADDGGGFDPDAASDRFGLVGMRERVGLAGGELRIDSELGEGTVVRAELPVRRAEERPNSAPSERASAE